MQTRDKKADELEKQVGQIAEFMGQISDMILTSTQIKPSFVKL